MKISVPTNWDVSLLEKINNEKVDEVYGKLARDAVGGGRISFILPHATRKQVASYVRKTHRRRLKFNYLLNGTCLGNIEWSRKGQTSINRLLGWLDDIGVDSVTVSMSYLLQLIKARYPRFKVSVSTQAGVGSLKEAQFWQDMGADRITLSVHKVNRDFKLLEALRRNLKCELQLIANLQCLKNCPFWFYHGNISSHDSQTGILNKKFTIDYSFIMCSYLRLRDPAEFIRSGWIRPEDVHYYEDLGIDRIKLVNRTMATQTIVKIVEAYVNQRHEGNLMDLFSDPAKTFISQKNNIWRKLKYLFHPFSINIFKLMEARKLIGDTGLYIEHRALDGFLEYFLKNGNCNIRSCVECGYCGRVAKKAVKIVNRQSYEELLKKYESFLESLISGGIFRYLPNNQ
jgi:collagenase-like PrtC family protease